MLSAKYRLMSSMKSIPCMYRKWYNIDAGSVDFISGAQVSFMGLIGLKMTLVKFTWPQGLDWAIPSRSVPQYSLLMQLINGQRTEAVDSMKSVRLLRCFDTVFHRPYRCFSIALKVILSLSRSPQNFHQWLTMNGNLSKCSF